jgi:hypothetical protein
MKFGLACNAALVLAMAINAVAQQAPEQKPPAARPAQAVDASTLTTEVYDIRDLLQNRRTRTAGSAIVPPTKMVEQKPLIGSQGGGGEGGIFGGAGNDPRPPAKSSPGDELMKAIMDTVDRESWRDAGGTIGAMRLLDSELIVSQTPGNQKAIHVLLNQLRASNARMVTVVARWVLLGSGEIEHFAQPIKQTDGSAAIESVNVAAMEKVAGGPVKYRAQVTCFNGQTVHLSSGRARTVVTGLTPVVGTGAGAYQPESAVVQDGVSLQLTPTLPQDSPTAIIDIESVVSEWGGLAAAPPAPTSQPTNMDAPTSIDRVDMQVQQLHTTIAVPVGKPILVGGLSLSGRGGKDAEGKQLYLVIEVVGAK